MGNLRAVVTIAAIAFAAAACGDDGGSSTADAPKIIDAAIDAPPDAYVPDAPNFNLTCYQNQAPMTATANVTLGGTAQEVVVMGIMPTIQNAAGVQVDVCQGNCAGGNRLDRQTTAANGTFTSAAISTGTNMTPLDGYLLATKTGNRTTYVYPASPLVANQPGIPVFMLTPGAVAGIGIIGPDQVAGNSIIGILVTDCSTPPTPIPGATIAVKQGGVAVGDPPFDLSTVDPMGDGAFLITNVPPNAITEVSATYNGMTFRAHTVQAVADTTTMTQVKPGF